MSGGRGGRNQDTEPHDSFQTGIARFVYRRDVGQQLAALRCSVCQGPQPSALDMAQDGRDREYGGRQLSRQKILNGLGPAFVGRMDKLEARLVRQT